MKREKQMKYLLIVTLICSCLCLPSYASEDYDPFYEDDGSLRDPDPSDGYTAEQSYGLLFFALFYWFVVVCGIGVPNPICKIIACILAIIGAIVMFQW